MKKLVRTLFTGLALLLVTACASFHQAQTQSPFKDIRQTTVLVDGFNGSCSGVVIAPNRVLTAGHCVALMGPNVDGQPATVMKVDETKDLLLYEVKIACPCTVMGDMPKQDTKVYLIGFPLGAAQIIREGRFQELFKRLAWQYPELAGKLILSEEVEHGFSGGGVYQIQNDDWKLIGIISAGADTHTIAPGIDMIKEFLLIK